MKEAKGKTAELARLTQGHPQSHTRAGCELLVNHQHVVHF